MHRIQLAQWVARHECLPVQLLIPVLLAAHKLGVRLPSQPLRMLHSGLLLQRLHDVGAQAALLWRTSDQLAAFLALQLMAWAVLCERAAQP